MKDFFRKHILIPPSQGVLPYFFLVFIIPLITLLLPITGWREIGLFLLLGVFLKAYRDGFLENSPKKMLFSIQLIISVIFVLYNGFASLFIYIGWQFPMWPIKKRTFKNYLIIYISTLLISSAISLLRSIDVIQSVEWLWIFVGLSFALLSPLAAYSVEKSQRQMFDLKMTNSRLTTLVRQKERERIAQDLHDHLGQSYSTISLKAELAQKVLAVDQERATKELEDIAQTSREHLNIVRKIVSNLHEQTIASAMIEAANLLETAQIKMNSINEATTSQWPLYIQFTLGSIIQEATTNVVRHSQATLVTYAFKYKDKCYELEIKDNGIGVQLNDKKTHGLSGMRNRVEDLNGQLNIVNESGTLIHVILPEGDFEYD